ncbi:MAG: helix-turn-helix domain-containing protein, partial [Litoreibacter sp.]|nr:helix-turn-helix domain-containing protein [Litoreibacter sp.]
SAGSPIIFIEGLERALNKINIDRTIKGLREINAVAQFEHNLLIEKAELTRAKAERKRIGRPPALSDDDQDFVRVALMVGKPVAAIARDMGVSRQTTLRVRQAM